jgi:hypothetical protein
MDTGKQSSATLYQYSDVYFSRVEGVFEAIRKTKKRVLLAMLNKDKTTLYRTLKPEPFTCNVIRNAAEDFCVGKVLGLFPSRDQLDAFRKDVHHADPGPAPIH